MPNQRLKGQEIVVDVVVAGVIQASLAAVKSFEVTRNFEITEEGYLGEKVDRYDEFFKGYSGKLELHFSDPGVFDFMQLVQDRATRRTPGLIVNIKAALTFPSGARRRLMFPNAFFGDMPMNSPGRGEYATVSLDFKGDIPRAI